MALNAFSVDVEDYFHVSAFESVVDRNDWSSMPSRVVRNTERVLEILEQYDTKATFFVLGWVAKRHPDLVRRIAAQGHEVACHGYSHRKVYTQERDVFTSETQRSKGLLEDCTGEAVIGYRAASFSITEESRWALDVLVDAGFQYDSSIYPVWHDNYGIPGAEKAPSVLELPDGRRLAEFPLTTVPIFGMPLPVGGGGYFRLYPYWLTRFFLKKVTSAGRPVIFYCHPWEIDIDQPRFSDAPLKSRFRHYNNIEKFESRLHRLFREYEFSSCRRVLNESGLLRNVDKTIDAA